MTLAELLIDTTEPVEFSKILAKAQARGIDTSQWTSEVNANLTLTHVTAEAATEGHNVGGALARANFLDLAEGEELDRCAYDRFLLTRYPSIAAEHAFILTSVPTAPAHTILAGEAVAGTPGSSPILFANVEAGELPPGGTLILRYAAQEAGATGNITPNSPLDLRNALVGATIACTTALVIPGADTTDLAGQVVYVRRPGQPAIQVSHVLGVALAVTAIGTAVVVTYAPTSTAKQVADAVNADALARILVAAKATGAGTGFVGPLALTALTSSVVRAGQDAEPDGSITPPRGLRGRCVTRWSTLGAGGSEEAMLYWARALPTGYRASPVTKVKAYSNRYAGSIAGAAGTIIVAGDAGALTPVDLAAVRLNYEAPKKYAMGTLVSIDTSTNRTITLAGTVYVIRGAKYGVAEVQTMVAAGLAAYQRDLDIGGQGGKLYKQKVGARIEDAAPTAIRNVALTLPIGDEDVSYFESLIFDPSALVYQLVDA